LSKKKFFGIKDEERDQVSVEPMGGVGIFFERIW
jgi:hypothetical protein